MFSNVRAITRWPWCAGARRCQSRSCSLRCACSTLTSPTRSARAAWIEQRPSAPLSSPASGLWSCLPTSWGAGSLNRDDNQEPPCSSRLPTRRSGVTSRIRPRGATTVWPAATSLMTMAFAPMIAPNPTRIGPRTLAPGNTWTLSSKTGTSQCPARPPTTTPGTVSSFRPGEPEDGSLDRCRRTPLS